MSDLLPEETKDFYRVEKSANHESCGCGHDTQWTIVYSVLEGEAPETIEIGTSWQGNPGKEAAQDICDLMNMAYEAGAEHGYDEAYRQNPPVRQEDIR